MVETAIVLLARKENLPADVAASLEIRTLHRMRTDFCNPVC